jgi:uncharacterized protein YndB with AHSA1/START domain
VANSSHVSVHIARSVDDVYDYLSDPAHLPEWAAGLSGSIELVEGQWVSDSPMGRVVVQFAAPNTWGVLDHDVTLPDGQTFHNPLRVLADGDGSELVFTVRQAAGADDAAFAKDVEAVRADLDRARELLEAN